MLCSVTILVLMSSKDFFSAFNLKGYAIPARVGRVVRVSLSGTIVGASAEIRLSPSNDDLAEPESDEVSC